MIDVSNALPRSLKTPRVSYAIQAPFALPVALSGILQLALSKVLTSNSALNQAVWTRLWCVDRSIGLGVLESVVEAQV